MLRDAVDVSKPEATPLFKLKPSEPIDYKNKGYDKFYSLPKTDLTVDKGVIFINLFKKIILYYILRFFIFYSYIIYIYIVYKICE